MPATIGLWEHFARLLDFEGREDRASFWPYAAVVFIIVMIVSAAIFVPMMVHAMGEVHRYAGQHPSGVTYSNGPGGTGITIHARHHPRFFSRTWMMLYFATTFGLSILLYGAAVVRRLHDRGMSGMWALMPLPFIIYSSFVLPVVFASSGPPNVAVFVTSFVSNILYLIAIIVLVIFLASAGTPGPNRFDRA